MMISLFSSNIDSIIFNSFFLNPKFSTNSIFSTLNLASDSPLLM